MERIKLSIRQKVLLGSVVIGLMLFLSGVVAYFEFGRMSRYVSTLITDNFKSVNSSRLMMNISDEYNTGLLEYIGRDSNFNPSNLEPDKKFYELLSQLEQFNISQEEKNMADSIKYAYVAYVHVVQELEDIWDDGNTARRDWYFNRLQGVYDKLKGYIQSLNLISQKALTDNYYHLKESFYRSIMPCVVAVCVGIILVILFNYFINIYILKPLVKISKGVENYRKFNKSYSVTFDYGGDQIQELNEGIKEIIEENKSLKKR